MKMIYLSAVIILSAIVQNCRKQNSSAIPHCIQQRINQIKSQHKWNPPAEVHEYTYNGKTVYLFSSDCCDQFNTLLDAQCNYICAPSGGITGKGDMKCPDFNEKAQHIKLVWKDER